MRVVQITPTYFEDTSLIGGGERYPIELSRWMAKRVDTTLVSFSSKRQSYRLGNLKVELFPICHLIHGSHLNPLSFRYLSTILRADVVHIHVLHTVVSDLACLLARILDKEVYVTDHGGGGSLVLNHKLPIFSLYTGAMAQSQFTLEYLPEILQKKATVIKGGIDTEKFCPDNSLSKEKRILYVGRILPHKAINYLIDGFRLLDRKDYQLRIVGRIYNQEFYNYLQKLAEGLSVKFIHDADDQQILQEYRKARITVLPSVHTDCYGNYTPVPELMGFTLLESQACGTPVICTDAGAMHEFVEDGYTGFIVKQNSGEEIADALQKLIDLTDAELSIYQQSCQRLAHSWSWSSVVKRHLQLYEIESRD